MIRFNIDLGEHYRQEMLNAVQRVVERGVFILDREVEGFEREWAEHEGWERCVAVGSGTDALRLALLACGIGPGDQVMSPALNVAYTALAIRSIGAEPVYCDVDPLTLLMSAETVRQAMTDRVAAVIPVHLYGHVCPMEEILEVTADLGVTVIEDACQAHGAVIEDHGVAACYSFYPTKNLGAWGDAGAVVTNDPEIADLVYLMRDGGRQGRYVHVVEGINSATDELQAAVLRVRLQHLDEANAARHRLADRYDRLLKAPIQPVPRRPGDVCHLYPVRVPDRDRVAEDLQAQGYFTLQHYPIPVHLQPALRQPMAHFPVAEAAAHSLLTLPLWPGMPEEAQEQIAMALTGLASGAPKVSEGPEGLRKPPARSGRSLPYIKEEP